MIIDLPPHIEQMIIQEADKQGISINELISQWAYKAQPQVNPMIALAMSLPKPTSYDKDGVTLQRVWRDEW